MFRLIRTGQGTGACAGAGLSSVAAMRGTRRWEGIRLTDENGGIPMRSATTVRLSSALLVAIGLSSAPASAAPIQLTPLQFAVQAAGLVTTVETFSGFPLLMPLGSPLAIANGKFTGQD